MLIKPRLRIGFTVQNIGMDFSGVNAAALQIKQITRALQDAGHKMTMLVLRPQRQVLCTENLNVLHFGEIGISGRQPFMLMEGVIRRMQNACSLPYLGLFDSYRFYEACCKNLSFCELLHERNNLFSIGTAIASLRLGIPYVLTLDADELFEMDYQGRPLKGIQRAIAKWMANLTYRMADALICVSQVAKDHFVSRWGIPEEKIWVIPNGVDTQFFQPGVGDDIIRSKLGLNGKDSVMFVGGFYPWHGLSMLVDSFRHVLAEVPNVQLVMIGDGETKPAIIQQVEDYGLHRSVTFVGAVDYASIPAYLKAAEICVAPYPKFSEEFWGSPLKLYEYMAAGKSIVASGAGIIADTIHNEENGLIVEPGDVNGFAQAIIRLLKNPNLREKLSLRARLQAVAQHSWERYVQQLEEVYYSVL